MKTKIVVFLLFVFILFFSFIFVSVSSQDAEEFELIRGKNNVVFNNTEKFYVKDLFEINENVEVVSYNVVEEGVNKSVGYIRAFGGVGENFIVESDKEYEIVASKNTTITLP